MKPYEELVNTKRYPIPDYLKDPLHEDVRRWRDCFERQGVCVLDDFIAPEALASFVQEANQLAKQQYHNTLTGNAYLCSINPNLPQDHAYNLQDRTALGVVAYDQIPSSALIRQIYKWPSLSEFLCLLLGREKLYEYACPLGALNISVMSEEDYLRWHFDQSDFVVSIHLQDAHEGGDFEFVHNLRSEDNPNYDEVKKVLEGEREHVQILKTTPGSLILFKGHNTLHRVSEIRGKTSRLVALLGYAEQPDVSSSDYLRQIRYGRLA